MIPDEYYSKRNKRFSEALTVLFFSAIIIVAIIASFMAIFSWLDRTFHPHFSDIIVWVKHLPIANKIFQ